MNSKPFRLRPIFAPLVKFLAKIAIKMKITPNMETWIMMFFAVVSAVGLLIWQSFLWFGIFVFITGLMDGVDGAIARLSGKISKFGGFFDSTFDRLSEGVIYGSIVIYAQYYSIEYADSISILTAFCFLFSYLISYSRARAELEVKNSKQIKTEPLVFNIGILARSERLFYLFIMSVVVQFTSSLVLVILLSIYAFLTCLTFFQRFFTYKTYLEKISVTTTSHNLA